MRLQLAAPIAALACVALPGLSLAQPGEISEVSSKVALYADDDRTTVLTTAVDSDVAVTDSASVGAHVLIDAVSTASVDVVSAATSRWTEDRVELGARVGTKLGKNGSATASYTHSQENDWQSHAISAGTSRDVAGRNARLSASVALVRNRVGRRDDPSFERRLDAMSMTLGVSQLISDRTLLAASYSLQRAAGYQASPYRYASIGELGVRMEESHPETRLRQALRARYQRALGDSAALISSYRFYLDDWGITSHTLESAFTLEAASWLDLRLRGRGYKQGEADFYADVYESAQRYVTADRELGAFWNAALGVKVDFYWGPVIVDLKLDAIHYRFASFSRLPRRNAIVAGSGARFSW